MLNWIKFITVFLSIVAITIIVLIYQSARAPFVDVERRAMAAVSNDVTNVTEVVPYNGNESWYVVYGERERSPVAILLDESFERVHTVTLDEGVSQREAIQIVKQDLPVQHVISAKLGYEDEIVFWEVVFKGENGKMNYVYVLHEDGKWWKRILNL